MTKHGAAWLVLSLVAVALLAGALYGFARKRPGMDARDQHISETRPAADAAAPRRPLVMAHRGGAGLWPENTAHAFAGAVALGADVLEMDLHGTADGALVVIHDATVDRTTNGAGRASALTLAELKRLDAGYRWTTDGGRTHPFRGKGITVPTLREVLAEFPRVRLNIDIKQAQPSLVKPFCRMLGESGAQDRVTVASFSSQTLAEFRRECPAVATSASTDEVFALLADLQAGRGLATDKVGFRVVQVPETLGGRGWLTAELVAAAHRTGLEVHVWTVNDEAGMRRMLDAGVDGIMTDYPDKLIALLRQTAAR
ncbi:MAG TPA: glycerophosphodiester phosphodiesterase [Pyrinomonadaceae bacterium]|jgi:glycerophosphoryl diester phosphodiesterase|nr:glycerophosphodiester phosphodiesterase [Pyrinomonadaceae bacterium]